MTKLTLTDVANLNNPITAITALNANSALIETTMENTLSRDGTLPNEMGAQLDMNSQRIINLPLPASDSEPLRYGDVDLFLTAITDLYENVDELLAIIPYLELIGDLEVFSANYRILPAELTPTITGGSSLGTSTFRWGEGHFNGVITSLNTISTDGTSAAFIIGDRSNARSSSIFRDADVTRISDSINGNLFSWTNVGVLSMLGPSYTTTGALQTNSSGLVSTGVLPISVGGTGATTVGSALTALGIDNNDTVTFGELTLGGLFRLNAYTGGHAYIDHTSKELKRSGTGLYSVTASGVSSGLTDTPEFTVVDSGGTGTGAQVTGLLTNTTIANLSGVGALTGGSGYVANQTNNSTTYCILQGVDENGRGTARLCNTTTDGSGAVTVVHLPANNDAIWGARPTGQILGAGTGALLAQTGIVLTASSIKNSSVIVTNPGHNYTGPVTVTAAAQAGGGTLGGTCSIAVVLGTSDFGNAAFANTQWSPAWTTASQDPHFPSSYVYYDTQQGHVLPFADGNITFDAARWSFLCNALTTQGDVGSAFDEDPRVTICRYGRPVAGGAINYTTGTQFIDGRGYVDGDHTGILDLGMLHMISKIQTAGSHSTGVGTIGSWTLYHSVSGLQIMSLGAGMSLSGYAFGSVAPLEMGSLTMDGYIYRAIGASTSLYPLPSVNVTDNPGGSASTMAFVPHVDATASATGGMLSWRGTIGRPTQRWAGIYSTLGQFESLTGGIEIVKVLSGSAATTAGLSVGLTTSNLHLAVAGSTSPTALGTNVVSGDAVLTTDDLRPLHLSANPGAKTNLKLAIDGTMTYPYGLTLQPTAGDTSKIASISNELVPDQNRVLNIKWGTLANPWSPAALGGVAEVVNIESYSTGTGGLAGENRTLNLLNNVVAGNVGSVAMQIASYWTGSADATTGTPALIAIQGGVGSSRGGNAWGTVLGVGNTIGTAKTINGITNANPAVVTSTAHGFTDGTNVYIYGVLGMTQVNNLNFVVAGATADTFQLSGINSTGYGVYVVGSGDYVQASKNTVNLIGTEYDFYTLSDTAQKIGISIQEHNLGLVSGTQAPAFGGPLTSIIDSWGLNIGSTGGRAWGTGIRIMGTTALPAVSENILYSAGFDLVNGWGINFMDMQWSGTGGPMIIPNATYLKAMNAANSAKLKMIGMNTSNNLVLYETASTGVIITAAGFIGANIIPANAIHGYGAAIQGKFQGTTSSDAGIDFYTGYSGTDRKNWRLMTGQETTGSFSIQFSSADNGTPNTTAAFWDKDGKTTLVGSLLLSGATRSISFNSDVLISNATSNTLNFSGATIGYLFDNSITAVSSINLTGSSTKVSWNADAEATYSGGFLAFTGADTGYTFDNDIYLSGTGRYIDFNGGDIVLTHSFDTLTLSGGVLNLTNGQLKFPATQNASADANTLDDYEESTWTPSVGGTVTVTGTPTYSGKYTKIGNVVYFEFLLSATTTIITTGAATTITGLPYAPVSGKHSTFTVILDVATSGGVGLLLASGSGTLYPPAITAGANVNIVGSGFYYTA